MVHQEKSKADPCGLVLTFSFESARTRRGSGVERTSGGRPRPRKTGCDICEANSSEMPRISCVDSRENRVLDGPPTKTSSELCEVFVYPSRRLGISSDFGLYLITEGVYHHALACIHQRLDDIQGYTLVIYKTMF